VGVGEGVVVALMTAAAIAVVLLTLPLAYRLAMRRGKAWVYSAAMLLGAMYLPWIAFMGFVPGVDKLGQALIFVAAMGIPMAAVFTFPNAITADIIDYDELRTGHRREAIYFGTQATLEKIASSLFPLILALLLMLGGTADNPLGIRLVGPVAGFSALVGFLTFRGYRLPDTVTAETVARRQRLWETGTRAQRFVPTWSGSRRIDFKRPGIARLFLLARTECSRLGVAGFPRSLALPKRDAQRLTCLGIAEDDVTHVTGLRAYAGMNHVANDSSNVTYSIRRCL
jgi:hypothetical protein